MNQMTRGFDLNSTQRDRTTAAGTDDPYNDTFKVFKQNKVTYKRPLTGHTRNKSALTQYSLDQNQFDSIVQLFNSSNCGGKIKRPAAQIAIE